MKVLKLEHSCLDIVEGSDRLIIDPGMYSNSLIDFSNITALVITHIHPDHFDPEKVNAIIAANPNIQFFSTDEVAEKVTSISLKVPERQKNYDVGAFTLEFFGKQHAVVDPSMIIQNFGVLVNQRVYYPGDSLTTCDKSFQVLALPAEAPWLTTRDLPEFLKSLDCQQVFPTHNGLINENGQELYNRLLSMFVKGEGKEFIELASGQSMEF
jgi:L-ascorbate metabolism protein UlaG (beta-lactamase superfamily)